MSHVILNKSVNMLRNVHRNHKAYWGQGEGAEWCMEVGKEGDYIYLSLYCHHQNDVCIRNKMGSDQSNFNVSLFVRDTVMGWCSQTTAFLKKKGQPKRI